MDIWLNIYLSLSLSQAFAAVHHEIKDVLDKCPAWIRFHVVRREKGVVTGVPLTNYTGLYQAQTEASCPLWPRS